MISHPRANDGNTGHVPENSTAPSESGNHFTISYNGLSEDSRRGQSNDSSIYHRTVCCFSRASAFAIAGAGHNATVFAADHTIGFIYNTTNPTAAAEFKSWAVHETHYPRGGDINRSNVSDHPARADTDDNRSADRYRRQSQ